MDNKQAAEFVNNMWDDSIIPEIAEYIKIPNKSPHFDPEWEAQGYMDELVSVPNTFWLDVYARFNNFCLGLGYEEDIVYDRAAVDKLRQIVREHPSMLLWSPPPSPPQFRDLHHAFQADCAGHFEPHPANPHQWW